MIAEKKKKRGRPKNIEDLPPDLKKLAHDDLQAAMRKYEYRIQFRDDYLDIRSRRRCEDSYTDTLLDSPAFEENTEELRRLAEKYFGFFYIDELPYDVAKSACEANGVSPEYAQAALVGEEEEDTEDLREVVEILAYKRHTRREYLEKKPPITDFMEGSFEKLPEEKQQILLEHKDEIFSENITYQGQVELVIRLVYEVTKDGTSGPTAIGRLFGVNKGTIATHYKRMNLARKAVVGRPGALDDDELDKLIRYIRQCYEEKNEAVVSRCVCV